MSIETDSRSAKIRIKPIYQALELHGVIRLIGGGHDSVEIEDEEGKYISLIRLLDGEHSVEMMEQKLSGTLSLEEIRESLHILEELGYLEDVNEPPNAALSPIELDRYATNINFFKSLRSTTRNATDYQALLKSAHVLILGLGGIGSNVCLALAELGVGKITAVEFDQLSLSNFNRQVLYYTDQVGAYKADLAKRRMQEFNPEIEFTTIDRMLSSLDEIRDVLDTVNPEFVFCLADKPVGRIDFWVNQACVERGIPYAAGSVNCGMGNAYMVIPGQSACYQCRIDQDLEEHPEFHEELLYYQEQDVQVANGALGPACMYLGYFLSYEFLRYKLELGEVLTKDSFFEIDFLSFSQVNHETPRRKHCPVCSQNGN